MQLQPDLGHPFMQRCEHLVRLRLAGAVHHRIVCVALEHDRRELLRQPPIERVMHEQVREHG